MYPGWSINACIKFHDSPSQSFQYVSLKTTKVNLIVALKEKSEVKPQLATTSGDHECLKTLQGNRQCRQRAEPYRVWNIIVINWPDKIIIELANRKNHHCWFEASIIQFTRHSPRLVQHSFHPFGKIVAINANVAQAVTVNMTHDT